MGNGFEQRQRPKRKENDQKMSSFTMRDVPVRPAIRRLKEMHMSFYSRENLLLNDRIFQEEFSKKELPAETRSAEAFCRFLSEKELALVPEDLFAGQILQYFMRHSQPLPDDDPFSFDPEKIRMSEKESVTDANASVAICRGKGLSAEEEKVLDYLPAGIAAGYFSHYHVGHVITGFEYVITTGFDGIEKRIREKMAGEEVTEREKITGNAMLRTLEGCRTYVERYREKAAETAAAADDPQQKENLWRIAAALSNISRKPASDLFEAIQFVILLQDMVVSQTKGSMSFGRLDGILYPFYQADRRKGLYTDDDVQELIDAMMLKFALATGQYQNLTLGGCDEQGRYAGNELSMMFLRSSRRLSFDQPLMSFRCTRDVPDEHWNEILKTIRNGNGFPALFWDDTIIASKTRMGIPIEDARTYAIVGCVETSICGKEFSNTEDIRINWCKTLELMLNNGVCPVSGIPLFLKDHSDVDRITDFGTFLDRYIEELKNAVEKAAQICNIIDRFYYQEYPSTLLTISLQPDEIRLDDCANRGTKYCNTCMQHTGIANAVNSLLAIRKAVFEEKLVTLPQLSKILKNNYEGSEELLEYIRSKCPKFGNDHEEADALAARLVNEIAAKTDSMKNERGGSFMAGFYSVFHHASLGRLTGALPDGRLAGESLANGLSPAQGTDVEGPTAVIHSFRGMDQTLFSNGMVLDMKFSPSFWKSENHILMLRKMIEVYFEEGGQEIQLNVVDRETLLDAKAHPEKHKNLIVRVSGFSAYFVTLFEELQDEIIRRTEYA